MAVKPSIWVAQELETRGANHERKKKRNERRLGQLTARSFPAHQSTILEAVLGFRTSWLKGISGEVRKLGEARGKNFLYLFCNKPRQNTSKPINNQCCNITILFYSYVSKIDYFIVAVPLLESGLT